MAHSCLKQVGALLAFVASSAALLGGCGGSQHGAPRPPGLTATTEGTVVIRLQWPQQVTAAAITADTTHIVLQATRSTGAAPDVEITRSEVGTDGTVTKTLKLLSGTWHLHAYALVKSADGAIRALAGHGGTNLEVKPGQANHAEINIATLHSSSVWDTDPPGLRVVVIPENTNSVELSMLAASYLSLSLSMVHPDVMGQPWASVQPATLQLMPTVLGAVNVSADRDRLRHGHLNVAVLRISDGTSVREFGVFCAVQTAGDVDHLTVTPDPVVVPVGAVVTITATAWDATGQPVPLDNAEWTWTKDDPSGHATLTATGNQAAVRGLSNGELTVHVSARGKSVSTRVVVGTVGDGIDTYFPLVPGSRYNWELRLTDTLMDETSTTWGSTVVGAVTYILGDIDRRVYPLVSRERDDDSSATIEYFRWRNNKWLGSVSYLV